MESMLKYACVFEIFPAHLPTITKPYELKSRPFFNSRLSVKFPGVEIFPREFMFLPSSSPTHTILFILNLIFATFVMKDIISKPVSVAYNHAVFSSTAHKTKPAAKNMQYRMHIYNPKIQNNDLTNYVQQKHFQM
jgi:hypothetical protein